MVNFRCTGRSFPIESPQTQTVAYLKQQIEEEAGIPAPLQRLLLTGKALSDDATLDDSIETDSSDDEKDVTLHLLIEMEGGGKKKKRKKRSGPPPRNLRHRKKKEPLAVLRCYEIDPESGKVTKTKRECPTAGCGGGGIRLAEHSDRLTCGKCGLSYKFSCPSGV